MKLVKKYHTIYADPPWPEYGGGKIKRGADRHYPLMRTGDIASTLLKVSMELAEKDCHLYLWTTNNHLPSAIKIMEESGFKYKTLITWAKDRIGLGQYFRGQTEHCLFGVKGNLPYKIGDGKRQQGTTLITAPRGEHSAKPEEMRQMIERVSYGPFLELYARTKTKGWDCWGNQIENDIELYGENAYLIESLL